jgi:hypothetical protein
MHRLEVSREERLKLSEYANEYWFVLLLLDARMRAVDKSGPQVLRGSSADI